MQLSTVINTFFENIINQTPQGLLSHFKARISRVKNLSQRVNCNRQGNIGDPGATRAGQPIGSHSPKKGTPWRDLNATGLGVRLGHQDTALGEMVERNWEGGGIYVQQEAPSGAGCEKVL